MNPSGYAPQSPLLSFCRARMIRILSFLFLTATALVAHGQSAPFRACGDMSYLDELEAVGARFYDNGVQKNAMSILKDHGMNMVRLRIWHTPDNGRDGLQSTLLMAKRIKSLDLGFMLDFHYSDYWADPGKQFKPAAWEGLNFSALRDSVQAYTSHVIQALADQDTVPDMVQIGNETTSGMLWDEGRVGGSFNTTSQWGRYAALTKAGIEGVKQAGGDDIEIMIHIDRGGDAASVRWFFDNLMAFNVDFDLIGLSYYPFWHGDLGKLEAALEMATSRFDKPVMLAEIAYPWTLQWFDSQNNFVGSEDQLIDGYPATPEGQRAMMEAIVQRVLDLPAGKGIGVCYWSPELWALPQYPTAWENLAVFDDNGEVLPAASALNPYFNVDTEPDGSPASDVLEIYPNPVTAGDVVTVDTGSANPASISVFDILGRMVHRFSATKSSSSWDTGALTPGLYVIRTQTINSLDARLLIVR